MNQLFFGDCLDILKKLYKENPKGFIDIIYIDPPFNSKRNYNVLFESIDLKDTKAQKEAFSDTWSNVSYLDTINEIQEISLDLYGFLSSLDNIKVSKSAISYLTTMSISIWYIHKVLNKKGSFYLHCDPTMSHYLKIVCDLIFRKENFRNEIIWKRMTASGFKGKKDIGASHDIILRYSKTENYYYNPIIKEYTQDYLNKKFAKVDENGKRFKDEKIGTATSKETIERLKNEGKIYTTKQGTLRIKHYLDEAFGFPIDDVWVDIPPINSQAKERLGYDTQKPLALLERIIKASSNEGDLVADFFCGCGTTIAASEKLNRKWLGVDISHLAIKLILKRLTDPYPEEKRVEILKSIDISGFPKDLDSARELATKTDKHRIKFQDWVVEILLGGVSNPKKTGDSGVDGHITFFKSYDGKQKGLGIIEVKSGNVTISQVRSFMKSVDSMNADLGIFACFSNHITDGMRREAKAEGYIKDYKIDRIQIISVDDLLEGFRPRIPGLSDLAHFGSSTQKLNGNNNHPELY